VTSNERRRPLPPTYLLLGLAAIVAFHFLLSGPRLVGGAWRLVGLAVGVVGFGLMLWSDALFKRLGTTIRPFRESEVLVTVGPYRLSRHPMYLSFMMMVAGAAVFAGTLLPLLVVPVMAWLFHAHFVMPEERHMAEQYGSRYEEYRARVRRWI